LKGPGEEHVKSRLAYFSGEQFQASKPYLGNGKTYSEIRYIFGPNSFFQILFVLLESTHFKAPEGSVHGKWMKMDLTLSSPRPLICAFQNSVLLLITITFHHSYNAIFWSELLEFCIYKLNMLLKLRPNYSYIPEF
jgi:hypothetical protein